MRPNWPTCIVLASLGLSSIPAAAQVVYQAGPGLNRTIADNTYNGNPTSLTCIDLTVPDGGTIVEVALRVGMSHTWVGDLVIKLRNPAGSSLVTVLSRPGVIETADDGSDTVGFGDSSNLLFANPVTFADAFAVSAESMGGTIGDTQAVCLNDGICQFAPNPGAALPGNLGVFAGQQMSGIWRLCLGDAGPGDVGVLDSWALVVTISDVIFRDGFEP